MWIKMYKLLEMLYHIEQSCYEKEMTEAEV
jgi:hypothetical protein